MKKLVVIGAVLTVGVTLGALSVVDGCTPAEQQQATNAISAGAACVISIVEDVTVAVDVAKTAATCGVAATDIYQIVSELLASTPDAGPDGALGASQREAHLRAWLDAASKARAAK